MASFLGGLLPEWFTITTCLGTCFGSPTNMRMFVATTSFSSTLRLCDAKRVCIGYSELLLHFGIDVGDKF